MTDTETSDLLSKLSLFLMRILHNVGVNRKIRKRRKRIFTQVAEMDTLCSSYNEAGAECVRFEAHIFGSQIEGATTPGLKSDIDIVYLDKIMLAVEKFQDSISGFLNLLMIMDENTYPGYFKLQYLHVPLLIGAIEVTDGFVTDCKGRVVLKSSNFHSKYFIDIHGPAATLQYGNDWFVDNIMGIEVESWEQQAVSWIRRPRRSDWISKEDFKYLVKTKAFLVPVGCPLSHERNLEWRISFTRVERELMWKLNGTQMACYILMKMIIKEFIKPVIVEGLCSYHCKTVLFYLIDNTDGGLWRPSNLLVCLNLILRTICSWVDAGFCPNYFQPDENMFLGKVSGAVRGRLFHILVSLIEQDFRYLPHIICDGVGDELSRACMGPSSRQGIQPASAELKSAVFSLSFLPNHSIISVIHPYQDLLKRCMSTEAQSQLIKMIHNYQRGSKLLQEGLSTLIGFLCSHIGGILTSQYLTDQNRSSVDMQIPHSFLRIGTVSDVASGRLKLAGFYLTIGYASLAEEVLTAVERDFNQFVSDVSTVKYNAIEDVTSQKIMSEDLTLDSMFRKYIAVCVVYLPSEIHCTPPPLCYEMFRSVGSRSDLRNPDEHFWYDLAVVDAKPYMYFLQHQTYSALGMHRKKLVALMNLAECAVQKRIIHRDTCLNLTAYCLRQEELIDKDKAMLALSSSIKIKPQHNAAIWQICDIFNQIVNDETLIYSRS